MRASQPHGSCRAAAEQRAGLRAPVSDQCLDLLRDSSQPPGGCSGIAQPADSTGVLLKKVAELWQSRMAKTWQVKNHQEAESKAVGVYRPHAHAGILTSRQRPAVRDRDSGSLHARPACPVVQRGLSKALWPRTAPH